MKKTLYVATILAAMYIGIVAAEYLALAWASEVME